MTKVKDGFYKQYGSVIGIDIQALLAGGGAMGIHQGRNNEANKIVRTDASGYIQAGWINTTSGKCTETLTRIYASNDAYIRYVTPADFFSTLANDTNQLSITIGSQNRKLTIAYATLAGTVTCTEGTSDYNRPIVGTNTTNGLFYTPKTTVNWKTGNIIAPTFTGKLITSNTGGSWISGKTNAAIKYDAYTAINNQHYHPILGVKTNSENVVNFGAYINNVGFYGYKADRTDNGYDWSFVFNSDNGNVTTGATITAAKFIGTLNNTLTFSTGAFSAKTYNNSSTVTINIPTHTSHLTNNSGYLTSRGYIGSTAVQASSAAQALTGITTLTMSEAINKVAQVIEGSGVAKLNITSSTTTVDYSHIYVSSNNANNTNNRPLVLQYGYGNVGIGVIAPSQKLHIAGLVNITNNGGTLTIGSQNASYTHYSTTGGVHWFNKAVEINGNLSPHADNSFTNGTTSKRWSNIYSVNGNYTGTLTFNTINIPTTSGGTTYGAGTNGQILKSNGTTVYWATDNNSNSWRAIQVNGTQIAGTGTGTYAANFISGTGITVTGTAESSLAANNITITNAGVRSTTINGDYLRVNTNGTNADLTIPFATKATKLVTSYNTITSVSDDTPTKWGELDSSVHMNTALNQLNDQPNQWGLILNLAYGSDVHQIWCTQSSGNLFHRGGNNSGWNGSWKTILDSTNSTVTGGGSAWGSSITVNIGGTSKTLTIPANPNTDTKVAYTANASNVDHPILFANNSSSTGNPTTGAVYYESNSTSGTGLTYNPYNNKLNIPGSGQLVINTTIKDHGNPAEQSLFIIAAQPASGTTITAKNSPGIGFKVDGKNWGSIVYNPASDFEFINSSATNHVNITAGILKSTIANGTAPLQVTSKTVVTNLNADMLDGKHASAFLTNSDLSEYPIISIYRISFPGNGYGTQAVVTHIGGRAAASHTAQFNSVNITFTSLPTLILETSERWYTNCRDSCDASRALEPRIPNNKTITVQTLTTSEYGFQSFEKYLICFFI